jgi:hypothetical protein
MNYKKSAALFLVVLVAGVYLITPVAAIDYGTISGTFSTGANTAPRVTAIDSVPATVNPTPDGVSQFTVRVTVSDTDGNVDFAKVEASLHDRADNNIEINYAQATSGWSVVDANTVSLAFTLQFNYFTPPSDYTITVTVTDIAGSTGTLTSSAIRYTSAIGLTIDGPTSLNFGVLTYGSRSASQPSKIHNSANTIILVRGTATDWTSSAGGSPVPASTLTADGIPMNSGTSVVQLRPGDVRSGEQVPYQLAFAETVPPQSSGFTLLGTYTTQITLRASAS